MVISDLEFLPVITPDKDDLSDPRNYANKVRNVFSEHLKLGVCEESLKEARIAQQEAKEASKKIKEEAQLKEKRSLDKTINKESKLSATYASNTSIDFVGNLTLGI